MTSLITNSSAMNALQALRQVNNDLGTTQSRISSGLKIQSAKDNAAYFQISETMKGDSGSYSSINEGLTLTKNSIATARLGAETFQDLATKFVERVAFAQGAKGGFDEVQSDLGELVKQMASTVKQSTFNGDDMVNASGVAAATANTGILSSTGTVGAATTATATTTRNVVTGVTRAGGNFAATTTSVDTVDLTASLQDFMGIVASFGSNAADPTDGQAYLKGALEASQGVLKQATAAATQLGLSEKTIEGQQDFLKKLGDNIDKGVGSMVDANMEEEAARLQALQTQQQLATQSLSIANQGPSSIMSLFRG